MNYIEFYTAPKVIRGKELCPLCGTELEVYKTYFDINTDEVMNTDYECPNCEYEYFI